MMQPPGNRDGLREQARRAQVVDASRGSLAEGAQLAVLNELRRTRRRAGPAAGAFWRRGGLDAAAEYGHPIGLAMLADRVWVPLRGLE